jgi:beta-lactamase class A
VQARSAAAALLAAAASLAAALPACTVGRGDAHSERSEPATDAKVEAAPIASDAPEHGAWTAALPSATASIGETVAWLGANAAALSPGTEIAVTVRDLETGEHASFAGDELHVSASVAKPLWVAAALDGADPDAVAQVALPIFERSDNESAGEVIDLLGASPDGPNRVNRYLWDRVGMANTALLRWSFGGTARAATNAPAEMGDDNYVCADDLITFLRRLEAEQILPGRRGALLRRWLTLTPRSGFAGWLGTRLPEEARRTMMHKAGWLVPGCCGADDLYSTLNEMGIIEAPGHHRYAVAILSRRGEDYWSRQVGLVELASCLVYRAVAREERRCGPPQGGDEAR